MLRTWKPTALYAFAHFTVDLGCAYAMFASYAGGATGYLLYNFFAFAMQMPCEETEKMSYIFGENICKLVVQLLSCEFSKSTNKKFQLENGQNS